MNFHLVKFVCFGFLLYATTGVITKIEYIYKTLCVCVCVCVCVREREFQEIIDPSHFLKCKYNVIVLVEISKAKLFM